MKRFMTMMAAVAVSATMFANENENSEFVMPEANYDVRMNNDAITELLNLNDEQVAHMEYVHDRFLTNMKKAENKNPENATKIVRKAVLRDLTSMRPILTDKQYRAYRGVLNAAILDHSILYY